MPGVRSERVSMSPAEQAKQDRRLARAIQQGMPMHRIEKTFHVTEARALEVAAHFRLTIAKGKNGQRRWG